MNNELKHYGIPGMRWGVRRFQNEDGSLKTSAKDRYKASKKEVKESRKELKKNIKSQGIIASRDGKRSLDNATQKYEQSDLNRAKAYADYKASKYKDASKSEKARQKAYAKEMKRSGLSGSIKDSQYNGRSTALYDQIAIQHGKEYADKIEKKTRNMIFAEAAASAVIGIGMTAVGAYLESR